MLRRVLVLLVVCALGLPAVTALCADASAVSVDALLAEARVAASNDRHAYSIQLYLRAVARDSTIRSDIGIELGNQYTWFDKPDSAVIWYNYYLEEHPDDVEAKLGVARALAWGDHLDEAIQYYSDLVPEAGDRKTEARLGLAKTYAWRGDHDEAVAVYKNILEDEPDNLDAELGRAQATNWAGRHREAEELYKSILERHPGNKDALEGLAYAQYWTGRNDLALQTIQGAPSGLDFRNVSRAITEKNKIDGQLLYVHRDNTSDGDFDGLVFKASWVPRYRTQIGFTIIEGRQRKDPDPGIYRDEFLGTLSQRFTTSFALSATAGVQLNSWEPFVVQPGEPPTGDFDLPVWDIYVTITPRDYLRIDIGTDRQTIPVPSAIYNKIDYIAESIGIDWRIRERLTLTGKAWYSDYSDANSRWSFREELDYRTPLRLALPWSNYFVAFQGFDHFSSKFISPLYFSPTSYTYPYLGLRFVTDIGDYVNVDVSGYIGYENSNNTEWLSKGGYAGEVSIQLTNSLYVNMGFFKSGSQITSPDGFRFTYYYVGLDYTYLP